jgi:hypothetical protein
MRACQRRGKTLKESVNVDNVSFSVSRISCRAFKKDIPSMSLNSGHLIRALMLGACLLIISPIMAQSVSTAPQVPPPAIRLSSERALSALRIRAWPRLGGETKRLDRKRFFLIKGGLEENRRLIEKINQTPTLSRDCYYRGIGASEALIKWLTKGDCESVYCREVSEEDLSGSEAVPEFQLAYARGQKEFGSRDVAREWLTVNLREEIRNGFYKRQQETLRALVQEAEAVSKAKVQSVMTDRKGSAYFTDIEPGLYVVSNLLPTEIGKVSILWNCEIEIKPKELSVAMKRPFLLTNDRNAPKKCFIEKELPTCATPGK